MLSQAYKLSWKDFWKRYQKAKSDQNCQKDKDARNLFITSLVIAPSEKYNKHYKILKLYCKERVKRDKAGKVRLSSMAVQQQGLSIDSSAQQTVRKTAEKDYASQIQA